VLATFIGLIPTVYATYVSNSITLFSDFLRCFVEFLAVLFAWLVLRQIYKTDASAYNYGFGKFEQIGSLALALAMFVSFLILAYLVQYRIFNPVTLHSTEFGLCVSTLAIFANAAVSYHYYRHSKRNGSPLIISQWKLFRAKTVASTVVVLSLLSAMLSSSEWIKHYSDPIGSSVVALFLLYSAYSIVSASMNDLVDRSLEEVFQLSILRVLVLHEDLYAGFQRVRSRRSGAKMHVDVHLEFDREARMGSVYDAMNTLSAELEKVLPGSDVHIVASSSEILD
jgi:cation diffusion facilitator family transporter